MRSSRVGIASNSQCRCRNCPASWILIPASSDTVESEGRQMKQCWIKFWKNKIIKSSFEITFINLQIEQCLLGIYLRCPFCEFWGKKVLNGYIRMFYCFPKVGCNFLSREDRWRNDIFIMNKNWPSVVTRSKTWLFVHIWAGFLSLSCNPTRRYLSPWSGDDQQIVLIPSRKCEI
jgi:hypothetical protein